MAIYIERVTGTNADGVESFDLERVRIGRNPDNDLKFDRAKDAQVGRYHAEIYREGGQYFVKDLQSRNGTFIAGKRIDHPSLCRSSTRELADQVNLTSHQG